MSMPKELLPLKYDDYGQQVFSADGQVLIADIRGWGYFQKKENGIEQQDFLGRMFAKAPAMFLALEEINRDKKVSPELLLLIEHIIREVTPGKKEKNSSAIIAKKS